MTYNESEARQIAEDEGLDEMQAINVARMRAALRRDSRAMRPSAASYAKW